MADYYSQKLSGRRLQRCYEVASARVAQYLEAEILFALSRVRETDQVLELGCGYGRIAHRLAPKARHVVGIDTAADSIDLARQFYSPDTNCTFECMNALAMGFDDGSFDVVLCLQNGICAFRVDPLELLREALRVTRPGGRILLSSYADAFWEHRLAWFEAQAAEGLVGPIDPVESHDGVIACRDGFRSGRTTPEEFSALCARLDLSAAITEIDGSSIFCETTRQ